MSSNTLTHFTLRAIDKIKPVMTAQKPDFVCATFEVDSLRNMINKPSGNTQKAIRSMLDMVCFSLTEFRIAVEQHGSAKEGYPAFALNSAKNRLEKSIEVLRERVLSL